MVVERIRIIRERIRKKGQTKILGFVFLFLVAMMTICSVGIAVLTIIE